MATEAKKTSTLQVRIVAGHDLINKDTGLLGDVSDPFVSVKVGKKSQKTPTIKDCLNPVWSSKNTFDFEIGADPGSLELEVLNENKVKSNQSLGKASIPISKLRAGGWQSRTVKLEGVKSGTLDFEYCFAATFDHRKGKMEQLIMAASDKAPKKMSPYLKQAAPYLAMLVAALQIAIPYVVLAVTKGKEYYDKVPQKILYSAIGFAMCFFGGLFPATIAAVEAWSLCGGAEAVENLKALYAEYLKLEVANKKDDEVDDDGDGIPDVDQISAKALLNRKTALALKATDPQKVQYAVVGLYTGWIGVLAILKIQFARTVTLGEVIGEYIYEPVSKVEPLLAKAIPEEYRRWVPVCTKWVVKATAISIAWWVQRVISAFHSAIRGGLMFSRYALNYLHDQKYLNFSDEQSYLDEVIGWSVAALGFLVQFSLGFQAPFPFNILLLPVSMVETFIVWSVSA